MIRTIADQYLAQNAGRRYPFADDADMGTGADKVPDNAILDFRCTIYGILAGTRVRAWLVNVDTRNSGAEKTMQVEVRDEKETELARLNFSVPTDIADAPYTTTALSATSGAQGSVTVTRSFLNVARGERNIPFAWTTVVCDSLKVSSIQSAQNDPTDPTKHDERDDTDPAARDTLAVLAGDVVLAEGRNTEPYLDGNHLRLDVFKGGGLGERCQSAVSGTQTCETVLFTINGERPGSGGELKIVGEDGITVTPDPANHKVKIAMDGVAAARMADGCAPACS